MLYFKACPRCRGDMHDSKDAYGSYVTCISCGYAQDTLAVAKTPDDIESPTANNPDLEPAA